MLRSVSRLPHGNLDAFHHARANSLRQGRHRTPRSIPKDHRFQSRQRLLRARQYAGSSRPQRAASLPGRIRTSHSTWRLRLAMLGFALMRIVLIAAAMIALLPHHSTAAYDTTKVVTLKGSVTSVDWRNPH